MHWYTDVLRKYAVFDGRAARPEYWWFALINFVIAFMIALVVEVSVLSTGGNGGAGQIAADLYILAVLLPSIGVTIRRLHDTDRSGWWILISFIPLIGAIVIIVLAALPGVPGPNSYGQNPQSAGLAPMDAAQPGVSPARFDPQTGQPLARFDPQTGQPLTPPPPADPPSGP